MSVANGTDVNDDGGIGGYEPKFVDVGGVRTRYYDVGTGDPLVLIHGGNWNGYSSANSWSATFEYLSDDFRVLAFDRIGCGMTDNPDEVEAFVYRSDIDHALGFLDALEVESCHLAGWSRGGGLATRIAVEEPERFETLVIANSATLGPPAGDSAHRWERIFEEEAHGLEKTDPEFIRYWYWQYSHETEYISDERCRTAAYMQTLPKARRTDRVMDDQGQLAVWQESLEANMNEAHQRIKAGLLTVPTLYVFGRNDLTVPLEMAMAAYDMIAQANTAVRMKIINDCGHMIFLEHPEEFSRTIADFVDFWH
ncbi:MAG: alpha/beta fold hydrolase [Halobacteriota archaeon]